MKRAISIVAVTDVTFILLLSLSGSVGGVMGDIFYYLSFVISFLLALGINKALGGAFLQPSVTPVKTVSAFTVPLAAPFVAAVMLISFLTSLVLGFFGFSSSIDLSGNIFAVILKHALLPAVLEELLFRFVPIALIAPYSKKNAVFISALFFSLIHCNLFQIPYALLAGFLLSLISVGAGSIIPAVIIHFLNNLASILLGRQGESLVFNICFFVILTLITAVSLVYVFIKRKYYSTTIKSVFEDKCKLEFTYTAFLLVFLTIFISIYNIWVNA